MSEVGQEGTSRGRKWVRLIWAFALPDVMTPPLILGWPCSFKMLKPAHLGLELQDNRGMQWTCKQPAVFPKAIH